MNINELNRITTINVEERLANVERGTGTFKEILDNVMSGVIIPLTDNSGMIIGIHYDTKMENLIDDSIEQRKFEIQYSCKPVMDWVLKSLQIKADGKQVADVVENEEGIKVITATGEVIEIQTPHTIDFLNEDWGDDDDDDWDEMEDELPDEVDVPMEKIGGNVMKDIKKYLRNTYKHYLSGFDGDPEVIEDQDEDVYHVYDIHWGRKI